METEISTIDFEFSTTHLQLTDSSDIYILSNFEISENSTLSNFTKTNCYNEAITNPLFIFLAGGIGLGFVSVIGVIGNILSILVLTRPSMRSSTNIILLGLSVCDLIYVIVNAILHGEEIFAYFCVWPEYTAIFIPIAFPYLLPILFIAQFGSVYFTVSVTLERFIVVYRPLRARSYCTVKSASWIFLIIMVMAILFTLPTWWESSYKHDYDNNGIWIGYQVTSTELLQNPNYKIYYTAWGWFIVYRVIPLVLLTVFNLIIYKKVREADKMRKTMSKSELNEISIAKMLICIVSIFLICNSLQIYLSLRTAFKLGSNSLEIDALSGLFLNLNSAINFVVYCLMGKKFRRICASSFKASIVGQSISSVRTSTLSAIRNYREMLSIKRSNSNGTSNANVNQIVTSI